MSFHGIPIPTTGRADWLAQRKGSIGASDVAGIVEMSPWATPFTVWAEKTQDLEDEPNEQMAWGSKLEGLILDEFEEKKDLHVHDRQLWVRHPQYEWATATLDGIVYESPFTTVADDYVPTDRDRALGNIEAKSEGGWGKWDEIPDHYQIQGQWQMGVTGFEMMWFSVLHGRRHEIYELEFEPGVWNMLLDRVNDFRARHITGGIGEPVPPLPDGGERATRILTDLWEPDDEESVTLDDQAAASLHALVGLKAEKKKLDARIKELENGLKASMGEATVAYVGGKQAITWKFRKGFHRKAVDVAPGRTFSVKLKEE